MPYSAEGKGMGSGRLSFAKLEMVLKAGCCMGRWLGSLSALVDTIFTPQSA